MSLAVLYVNSKDADAKYVKEASKSASSFRKYLPDARYYLYTNFEAEDAGLEVFDEVVLRDFVVPDLFRNRVHLNGQMFVKHAAMLDIDEDHVLYLGADTYALKDDVSEIERALERFDIAAAHAPVRINTELGNSPIPEVPKSFPELNCDLILYRNNSEVRSFIENWKSAYAEDLFSHPHDQGTFRYCLYKSTLRLCVLPPEYNYRGHSFREDTVILQNRYALEQYLGRNRNPVSRLLRRLTG
jgi:hypothetical protein